MEKTHSFLPYFFTAFFALVVYCFYQSYFGHFPDFENVISPIGNVPITITTITHFHAAMIILWFLMLIIQPILIIKKQIKWHRMVGKASYIVVALIVISILMVINQEQIREKSLPVLAANLFDLPVFIVFYGLAIYYRKKTAYHSRFMIMTILPFINPALARLNVDGLKVQIGLWVLLFVVEFFNNKNFKPYLIGLGYYVANLTLDSLFVYHQSVAFRQDLAFFLSDIV